MSNNELLIFYLMFGLVTKHFICDFILQTNYQASNKHIIGHFGGILHSGIHIIGTIIVGVILKLDLITLAFVEGALHYFIDYFKMNINILLKWNPSTYQFWWALGFDQYLHYLCYFIIIKLSCGI